MRGMEESIIIIKGMLDQCQSSLDRLLVTAHDEKLEDWIFKAIQKVSNASMFLEVAEVYVHNKEARIENEKGIERDSFVENHRAVVEYYLEKQGLITIGGDDGWDGEWLRESIRNGVIEWDEQYYWEDKGYNHSADYFLHISDSPHIHRCKQTHETTYGMGDFELPILHFAELLRKQRFEHIGSSSYFGVHKMIHLQKKMNELYITISVKWASKERIVVRSLVTTDEEKISERLAQEKIEKNKQSSIVENAPKKEEKIEPKNEIASDISALDRNTAKAYGRLIENDMARHYLNTRGIDIEILFKAGVGLTKDEKAFAFPIRDQNDTLQNIQYHSNRMHSRYWSMRGRTMKIFYLNFYQPDAKEIYFAEGIIDCLVLNSCGFHSITTPCGVHSLPNLLVSEHHLFNGKKIYLAFDNDDAGKVATWKSVIALTNCCEVYYLDWEKIPSRNKDISSYIECHGREIGMRDTLVNAFVSISVEDAKCLLQNTEI